MPFRFDSANCVAVGTFNIYIIQPSWLSDRWIIPKGVKVAIGSRFDEPGFRFHPQLRAQWVVKPSVIEVNTEIRLRIRRRTSRQCLGSASVDAAKSRRVQHLLQGTL